MRGTRASKLTRAFDGASSTGAIRSFLQVIRISQLRNWVPRK